MVGSDIRKTTEAYLQALGEQGDFGRFLADAVTVEIPGIPVVAGRVAVEDFIRTFHSVSFDAAVSVRRILADDDGATAELVFDGVHTGEFAGVPASGTRVRLPYCAAYDVDGDAITAMRVYLSVPDLVSRLRS